jgi:hypothetical protein
MPENHQSVGLTIGEIAAQIASLTPDPVRLTERVRHLAKIGFFDPVGNVRQGTGKHLRYGKNTVYEAGVLLALLEAAQRPGQERWIADMMPTVRQRIIEWQKERAKGPKTKELLFEIGFKPGGGIVPWDSWEKPTKLHKRAANIVASTAMVTIRINLGLLFETVWKAQHAN